MTHKLKTWPQYFSAIKDGRKSFEARLNDRDFHVGDILCLQEWVECKMCGKASQACTKCGGNKGWTTGAEILREVAYIVHGPAFGILGGHCVMAIIKMKAK